MDYATQFHAPINDNGCPDVSGIFGQLWFPEGATYDTPGTPFEAPSLPGAPSASQREMTTSNIQRKQIREAAPLSSNGISLF